MFFLGWPQETPAMLQQNLLTRPVAQQTAFPADSPQPDPETESPPAWEHGEWPQKSRRDNQGLLSPWTHAVIAASLRQAELETVFKQTAPDLRATLTQRKLKHRFVETVNRADSPWLDVTVSNYDRICPYFSVLNIYELWRTRWRIGFIMHYKFIWACIIAYNAYMNAHT